MNNNKTKHIEIAPYNPNWPQMFEAEAAQITKALGNNLIAIHHIGSTSVPGLVAKPIIDIIVVVRHGATTIKNLETLGFVHKGEYNIPMRFFFSRSHGIATNLHVYEDDNPQIELNLLFRDYLRSHSDAIREYAEIKQNLLQDPASFELKNSKFSGYTLGKDAFIRKILQETGFDKLRLMRCAHYAEWDTYHRICEEQILKPLNIIYNRNHPHLTAENHFHFVLYKGVEIVSVAHVEFLNDNEAALRSLATDEPYKNHGFGKAMMGLLEKWIEHHGRKLIIDN